MTKDVAPSRALGIWLIVASVIGWFAAFELTVEKFHLLREPGSLAACDISPLVQCSANLDSPQGALFGFPNPILGLTGWMAPLVVGVAIVAGIRFPRWFWNTFWVGILGAFALVVWLISQSIFVLGTLCPWCMVTWTVTIPTFYAVTLHVLRTGSFPVGEKVQSVADRLMSWVPLMAVVSYAIIAVMAELRLDVLAKIF